MRIVLDSESNIQFTKLLKSCYQACISGFWGLSEWTSSCEKEPDSDTIYESEDWSHTQKKFSIREIPKGLGYHPCTRNSAVPIAELKKYWSTSSRNNIWKSPEDAWGNCSSGLTIHFFAESTESLAIQALVDLGQPFY